jgi:hypothetical protein
VAHMVTTPASIMQDCIPMDKPNNGAMALLELTSDLELTLYSRDLMSIDQIIIEIKNASCSVVTTEDDMDFKELETHLIKAVSGLESAILSLRSHPFSSKKYRFYRRQGEWMLIIW